MRLDQLMLAISAALFAVFFTNVGIGAAGNPPFMTDVVEMLVLFASVGFFTVGVLRREAMAAARAGEKPPDG